MPTGYTAAVADGKITTLRDFALTCARGMGACIMMRDEPYDAPIPERFEPSTDYYDQRIVESEQILAEVPALSADEAAAHAAEANAKALADWEDRRAGRRATEHRYKAMLADVVQWKTDAEGIREFMIEQLQGSIEFDCGHSPFDNRPEPMSGEEWRADMLARATRDLAYAKDERAKEIERTEGRNRWLTALRASLPPEPGSESEAA